jgi:hypothetical protein
VAAAQVHHDDVDRPSKSWRIDILLEPGQDDGDPPAIGRPARLSNRHERRVGDREDQPGVGSAANAGNDSFRVILR